MRILLVEDDHSIRRAVADHFSILAWEVTEAMDGQLGYDLAMNELFDVIILDVMLPQISGFDICKSIRMEGKNCPIIMLTAKSSEEDVLRGFNYGATDYVRKPFSLAELTARVRIHGKEKLDTKLTSGDFALDINLRMLTMKGTDVSLTEKEALVLAYLMENQGKVMTREAILNRVWGNQYLQGIRSVDRCIKTLRRKIESAPASPVYIKTVRQVGYLWA